MSRKNISKVYAQFPVQKLVFKIRYTVMRNQFHFKQTIFFIVAYLPKNCLFKLKLVSINCFKCPCWCFLESALHSLVQQIRLKSNSTVYYNKFWK